MLSDVALQEATVDDIVLMVYLAYYKDEVDLAELIRELQWRAREHYETVLREKVAEAGCDPSKVRLEDLTELTALYERVKWAATSIVGTYNKNLRSGVEQIVEQYADDHDGSLRGLNRNVLAYRVRQWNSDRDLWKTQQIAITEATHAAHRAATQFLWNNAIEAKVYVRPVQSVCAICEEMVRGSPYTVEQARRLPLPAHPNCVARGTKIDVEGKGLVRIEAVMPGIDRVRGRKGYSLVEKRIDWESQVRRMIRLTTSGKTLAVTDDHPVWVSVDRSDAEWLCAGAIEPGNMVMVSLDGWDGWARVERAECFMYVKGVYDLTTASGEYYADGILVHNCPHVLDIRYVKSSIPECRDMWTGQPLELMESKHES